MQNFCCVGEGTLFTILKTIFVLSKGKVQWTIQGQNLNIHCN